mgnify:CR=1 FL=1
MESESEVCSCTETGECVCMENGGCDCTCACLPCITGDDDEALEGCACGGNCGCGTDFIDDIEQN